MEKQKGKMLPFLITAGAVLPEASSRRGTSSFVSDRCFCFAHGSNKVRGAQGGLCAKMILKSLEPNLEALKALLRQPFTQARAQACALLKAMRRFNYKSSAREARCDGGSGREAKDRRHVTPIRSAFQDMRLTPQKKGIHKAVERINNPKT
jgi:hypothetical protein